MKGDDLYTKHKNHRSPRSFNNKIPLYLFISSLIEKQYRALGKGARVRLIMGFFMRITDANEELLEELFCSVDDKIIRILISIPRPVIYKIYYTLAKYAKSSKNEPNNSNILRKKK